MAVMFAGRGRTSGPTVMLLLAALLGTSYMADREPFTGRETSELQTKESSKLQARVTQTANSTMRMKRVSARRAKNTHLQCEVHGPDNSGFKMEFTAEKGCGREACAGLCGPCSQRLRDFTSAVGQFFSRDLKEGVCQCSVDGRSVVMTFPSGEGSPCSQAGCANKYLQWYNARDPSEADDLTPCNVDVTCYECPSKEVPHCHNGLLLPTEVTFQDPNGILDGGKPNNNVEELPATNNKKNPQSEIDFIEPTAQDIVVISTKDGPQSVDVKKIGENKVVITGDAADIDPEEQIIRDSVIRIGTGNIAPKKRDEDIVDEIKDELDPNSHKVHQDIKKNPMYQALVTGLKTKLEEARKELEEQEIVVPIVPEVKKETLKRTPGIPDCGNTQFPQQCVLMPKDIPVSNAYNEAGVYRRDDWKEKLSQNGCRGQTIVFGLPKDHAVKTAKYQKSASYLSSMWNYAWGTKKVDEEEAIKEIKVDGYLAIVIRDTTDILDDLNSGTGFVSKLKITSNTDVYWENSKIVIEAPNDAGFNPIPQSIDTPFSVSDIEEKKVEVTPYEDAGSLDFSRRKDVPEWVASITFQESSSDASAESGMHSVNIKTHEQRVVEGWGTWGWKKATGYDLGMKVKKYWAVSSTPAFSEKHLAKCEIKDKYDIPEEVTIPQPQNEEWDSDEFGFGNDYMAALSTSDY